MCWWGHGGSRATEYTNRHTLTQILVPLISLLHASGLHSRSQKYSICSVTEMLFIVDTQARTNSLCGHVDRVSELWLQAYSVCVCVCVVFSYLLMIGAAPSRSCLSSVPSSHNIIVSFSLPVFQAVPSSPTVPESQPWKPRMHCTSRRPCQE